MVAVDANTSSLSEKSKKLAPNSLRRGKRFGSSRQLSRVGSRGQRHTSSIYAPPYIRKEKIMWKDLLMTILEFIGLMAAFFTVQYLLFGKWLT